MQKLRFKDKIYLVGYNYADRKQAKSIVYHQAQYNNGRVYLCDCCRDFRIGKKRKMCGFRSIKKSGNRFR